MNNNDNEQNSGENKFPTNNFFKKNIDLEKTSIDSENNLQSQSNSLGLSPAEDSNIQKGHSNLNEDSNTLSSINDLINNKDNIDISNDVSITNISNDSSIEDTLNKKDEEFSNSVNLEMKSDTLSTNNNNNIPQDNNTNSIKNNPSNNNLNNNFQDNNISYDEQGFENYLKKPLINKWILIGGGAFIVLGIIVLVVYLITKTGTLKGITIKSDDVMYVGEESTINIVANGSGNLGKTNVILENSDSNMAKIDTSTLVGSYIKTKVLPYTTGKYILSGKGTLDQSKVLSNKKEVIFCKKLSEDTVPPEKFVVLLNKPIKLNVNLGADDKCYENVTVTIENEVFATIDENRIIKGKSEGTTAIILKQGNKSITSVLQILAEKNSTPATGISVDKKSLNMIVGDTNNLSAVISPLQATNKNVIWTSNNEKIVKVNTKGEVTALNPGGATITVTTEDGKYKAQTNVVVTAKTINPNEDDKTSPVVNYVSIKSNNPNNKSIALEGNIITLTVQFSETLGVKPKIVILDKEVEAICGSGATPTCVGTIKVSSTMPNGLVNFKIVDYKDLAGNIGVPVTITTDNSQVNIA